MLFTYLNLIIAVLVILLENGIYLQLIALMLFNLSVYTIIAKNSYRSVTSYFIISTLCLLLLILGYCINLILVYLIIVLISIVVKLNCFPFTSWIIPIYNNLKINISIVIIIASKILYLILFAKFGYGDYIYLIILLILIIGTIACINSNSIIELLVYSGSMQLSLLFIAIIMSNLDLYLFYILLYLLTISIIIRINDCGYKFNLKFALLSICLYNLVGIPPFIGFLYKLSIISAFFHDCLNNWSTLFIPLLFSSDYFIIIKNLSGYSILVSIVISSIYISYLYLNNLHKLSLLNYFNNLKLSGLNYYFSINLFIFTLFYLDIILW